DARSEASRPRRVEGVPAADAEPKLILPSLAQHYPVRVIDLERQRIRRIKPAEWDWSVNCREKVIVHSSPSSVRRRATRDRSGVSILADVCLMAGYDMVFVLPFHAYAASVSGRPI